jgi:hypothetical protein
MAKTTGENRMKSKNRPGIPMTEEALKEWQQVFIDIEESIDGLDYPNCKPENLKYLKLKQQELF